MSNHDGVHASHCCVVHGCKYRDDDCPVQLGTIEQKFMCMDCEADGIESTSTPGGKHYLDLSKRFMGEITHHVGSFLAYYHERHKADPAGFPVNDSEEFFQSLREQLSDFLIHGRPDEEVSPLDEAP